MHIVYPFHGQNVVVFPLMSYMMVVNEYHSLYDDKFYFHVEMKILRDEKVHQNQQL